MINTTPALGVYTALPKLSIEVNFPQSLLQAPKKLTKKLPGTIRRIAMEGKSFWKAEAGRKLRSSRKKYQDAISFTMTSNLSFDLTLNDPFAYRLEAGSAGFNMKPALLKNALPWPPKKRKFPRHVVPFLAQKSSITQYKIIPLNIGRNITLTKPKAYRTVHDQSTVAMSGPNVGNTAWQHPGFKGINLADAVVDELVNNIIPKHMDRLLNEVFSSGSTP